MQACSHESMGAKQENNLHYPHYTIVRKPSPVKQLTQCLAHSTYSITLISPVEMVLSSLNTSVTYGLKGTFDYIFFPWVFLLTIFNFFIVVQLQLSPFSSPYSPLPYLPPIFNLYLICVCVCEKEREREREGNIDLLFYLFMHSLVDSCMCPDLGWKPQLWCTGTMLQPT